MLDISSAATAVVAHTLCSFVIPTRPVSVCVYPVHDLSALSSLTESSVLHLLRERFFRRHIYSYSGSTLISINPFRPLPHLYSNEVAKKYEAAAAAAAAASSDPTAVAASSELDQLPPHLFRVADAAYRDMVHNRRSQSIVIGGESGAGKTEALKYVLRYLTGLSSHTSPAASAAADADGAEHAPAAQGEIELKLMDSNPLLESFGNCRTIRNNNSSRYGRYIRVHFNHGEKRDSAGGIRNAEVAHYLLERSRVVHAAPNERSFHCLYQLVSGVSDASQRAELCLPSSSAEAFEQFHYLSRSGCTAVAGMDDAHEFARTVAAMARLGISDEEQRAVWRILAAILQLGNVQIKARGAPDESARVAAAEQTDPAAAATAAPGGSEATFSAAGLAHLANFASLLALDGPSPSTPGGSALECAISSRVNYIRGEKFIVPYSVDQSLEARDGVAKEIYARLFDFLLSKVNQALKGSESETGAGVESSAGSLSLSSSRDNDGFCIGILDIFGQLNTCARRIARRSDFIASRDRDIQLSSRSLSSPSFFFVLVQASNTSSTIRWSSCASTGPTSDCSNSTCRAVSKTN